MNLRVEKDSVWVGLMGSWKVEVIVGSCKAMAGFGMLRVDDCW